MHAPAPGGRDASAAAGAVCAVKTYIAQRLGIAVLTLFGMSVVIFVLLRLAPGDIVDILFAAAGYVNEADKRRS